MFRTKSLTSQEMKNLIQKNRPNQIQKQNRNFSLRTLIADKTTKYHKHMEKLIQQSNCITFSGQKSQKKTPRRALDQMSRQIKGEKVNNSQVVQQFIEEQMISQITIKPIQTKQFQSDISIVYVESLPTFHNQKIISEQNQDNIYSYIQRSRNNSVNDRSDFKISLQNQQLMEENKELRRQIQHLHQRLETSQLIKIQKESQAESLKLKIKILQLKIQDYEEKEQQSLSYYTKFSFYNPKPITIQPKMAEDLQIQTNESLKSIQALQQLTNSQQKLLINLKQQVCQLQQFLYKTINLFSLKKEIQVHMTIENRRKYKNVVEAMSQLIRKQRQTDKKNLQIEKQKNIELEQRLRTVQKKNNTLELSKKVYQTALQEKNIQTLQLEQKLKLQHQSYYRLQERLEESNLKIRELSVKLDEGEKFRVQIQQNKIVIQQQKQRNTALQNELSGARQQYEKQYSSLLKEFSHSINEWENKYYAVQAQFQQKTQEWKNTSEQLLKQMQDKANENSILLEQNQKLQQNARVGDEKFEKLKQLYEKKVSNLVNLLNLAQAQIKSLLIKLRQAKDHDIANYKQMIAQFVGRVQVLELNQHL